MVRVSATEWTLFRRTAASFAVVGIALAVVGLTGLGGQDVTRAVSDASFVVFSGAATLACARAAGLRRPGRRLPWWLLCGASACYAIGNVIWFYYQVLAPDSQTYPGPADAFYVAVVPFAVAAMLTLPSQSLSTAGRARAIADGLLIAASLLFVSWIVVLHPLVSQLGDASWIYLAVYLYYPLTDILVISIASGLGVRAAGRERLPMLMVAAAFVAIACADTGISYLALDGREAAGSGLDLGWTYGYMLLALAALVPGWEVAAEERADPRALVRELLPYAPVFVVLVVAVSAPSRLTDGVLVGLLAAVVALLVIRHALTLADNFWLTARLEDRVRIRTRDLERLTRRHQSILDSAGEGIVGLDEHGVVTFANPAAAKLLGRSTRDLVGAGFRDVAYPRRADGEAIGEAEDPITDALSTGESRTVSDLTYRRAGKTRFAVELTVAPAHTDGGGNGGVVMFRDVTERRAVDQMKDEFVSVVSHELRTPLTSLRGALGLLQGGLFDIPPTAQRMMTIAVDSTDRLIRLINDILDIERIAAGRLALHRQICSAPDLVERAVTEMRGLAGETQVRLEVGAVAGWVDADHDRIVQTLTNLISNAIKFSPADGTVHVSAQEQDGTVVFSVADHGPGIPSEHLEAVFGRFAQVDTSDTREKAGSGLGLAICRGIVDEHDGQIWAESELGKGATVRFRLPRADAVRASDAGPAADRPAASVLVCEDDPQTREVISELLRSRGYAVVGVGSGEEAVATARRNPPAAVLMDIGLPGIDGLTAIKVLRADDRTREIPVLIVSGTEPGPQPPDVAAWLTKPLDLTKLLGAVGDAVTADTRPCVLVVEDDPALTEILVTLFASHGVVAIAAHSARDALRISKEIDPDLLLLDLMLPDHDGFTLVDWLREDVGASRIPLVVYSALDLDEADRQRLRLGPTEFFTKATTSPEDVEKHALELLDTVVTGAVR